MSRRDEVRQSGVRRVAAVLVGCAVLAAGLVLVGVGSGAQAQGSPYTVTVTPTSEITDGRQLTVNVKTDLGNVNPIYEAQAYVCRANVTYLATDGPVPSSEGRQGGPNCPPTGLSTSAQPNAVSSRTYKFAPTPEGENLFLRVGVGVVEWSDTTVFPAEMKQLTCDAVNPCSLVVQLKTNFGWEPQVFELGFQTSDAVSTCGGAAPGVLSGAASDSLSDAWVDWTLDACATSGEKAWTTLSLGEESVAVRRFAEGQIDIAYTALGYNPEAGFVADIESPRPAVAVPVAISAAGLALGNGWLDPDGRKLPFGTAAITLDELTTLMTGGEQGGFRDLAPQIGARNPELSGGGFMLISDRILKVGGPAEGGVSPWTLTRHVDALRPERWKVPDLPFFAEAGQPRGVHPSFPLAVPSFQNVITTLTGRPALAKSLAGLPATEPGAIWVLGDLTTAEAFDLSPVALENVAGQFVAPTPETMTAAVPSMPTASDGMRVPNPSSTEGYPLTHVVYAMVPAQPLTDASGACRTDSQALLTKWLSYVTEEGQTGLPAGMAPLTPELKAEADAAITRVGQTPGAPCPVPGGPGGGSPTGAPPSGGAPAQTTGAVTAGSTSGRGATGARASADADAVEQANAELTVSESDTPGFFGGALPSMLAAMGALLGVGLLTAFAAKQTSGRRASAGTPPGPDVHLVVDQGGGG